ncbi:MAG: DDE-type integrase/transposase/recombinase, partial [Nitrososphaeraceae archaeon]
LNLKRFKNGMWGTIIQPKYLPEPKPDNNNSNNPSITKINQTVPLADYQEQIRRLKIEERKLKEKQEMDKMIDNFDRKLQNGDIELPQEIENNAITKATINELNEHRKQNAGRIPKYKNATENKESSKHQMTIKTRNGNNSQNSRSQSQTHVTYQDEDSEQEMYFSDEDLGTDNNSNSYSHFTLSTYENTCALVTNESQEPETQIEIVKVDQEDLNKAITLHNKFAHPGINTMIELNKEYKLGITDKVLKALKQTKCETCLTTKAKRKSIRHKNTEPNRKSLEVLDTFCCDLIGPLSSTEEGDKLALPSINGEYYILIVVDQFSKYIMVRGMKQKSEASEHLMEIIRLTQNRFNKTLKRFHSDGGKEFINDIFLKFLKQQGTELTYTPADTPQFNGEAESANKTIITKARSILNHVKGCLELWNYAIQFAVLIYNYTTKLHLDGEQYLIPGKIFNPQYEFNIQNIHIFGCNAYVLKEKNNLGKLDTQTKPGIYVGYNEQRGCHKILNSETLKLIESRDVQFDENNYSIMESIKNRIRDKAEQQATIKNKEYEVEFIQDEYTDPNDNSLHYLVKWKHYKKPMWIPQYNLTNCQQVIEEFLQQ